MQNKIVINLSKETIVDAVKVKSKPLEEIQKILEEATARKLPITYVEDMPRFFNRNELLPAILKGEDISARIEYHRDKGLTKAESDAISNFLSSFKVVKNIIDSLPKPKYTFADIPPSFKLTNYSFTKTKVSRAGYYIGTKSLEKIWLAASKVWAGRANKLLISEVQAYSSYRYVEFTNEKNTIRIGCQNIQRHELEQVALHLGWEFPS